MPERREDRWARKARRDQERRARNEASQLNEGHLNKSAFIEAKRTRTLAWKRLGLAIAGPVVALGVLAYAFYSGQRPSEIRDDTWIVGNYYPEFHKHQRREDGVFKTQLSSTRWFNSSNLNFNQDEASKFQMYLETLQGRNNAITSPLFGKNVLLVPSSTEINSKAMFIIPPDAQFPYLGEGESAGNVDPNQHQAFTAEDTHNRFIVSYIKSPQVKAPKVINDIKELFTFNSKDPNQAVMVEMCQSTIRIPSNQVNIRTFGQEVYCNYIGTSASFRLLGVSYEVYAAWADKAVGNFGGPTRSDLNFRAYKPSRLEYDKTPLFQPILRSRS